MQVKKNFIRKKENFICEVCGTEVIGTGYTNHCSNCLRPGDRVSPCQGLMEPIGVEIKAGEDALIHCCQKCGKVSKNKTSENDNFEKILKVMKIN